MLPLYDQIPQSHTVDHPMAPTQTNHGYKTPRRQYKLSNQLSIQRDDCKLEKTLSTALQSKDKIQTPHKQ